jgi:hypothetical protein
MPADLIAAALAKIAELRAVGRDLRWKADMRAIERWRGGNPKKRLVMPDHVDLCCWLLDENNRLTAEALRYESEIAEVCGEDYSLKETFQTLGKRHNALLTKNLGLEATIDTLRAEATSLTLKLVEVQTRNAFAVDAAVAERAAAVRESEEAHRVSREMSDEWDKLDADVETMRKALLGVRWHSGCWCAPEAKISVDGSLVMEHKPACFAAQQATTKDKS